MKKESVLLITTVFAIIFFLTIEPSFAWHMGKVEKKGVNYEVSLIKLRTDSGRTLIVRLIITPEIQPIMKSFFEVKEIEDLSGIDRDKIKKEPPEFIKRIDKIIKEIEEKYYKKGIDV